MGGIGAPATAHPVPDVAPRVASVAEWFPEVEARVWESGREETSDLLGQGHWGARGALGCSVPETPGPACFSVLGCPRAVCPCAFP